MNRGSCPRERSQSASAYPVPAGQQRTADGSNSLYSASSGDSLMSP
jgi:hypothetical protein